MLKFIRASLQEWRFLSNRSSDHDVSHIKQNYPIFSRCYKRPHVDIFICVAKKLNWNRGILNERTVYPRFSFRLKMEVNVSQSNVHCLCLENVYSLTLTCGIPRPWPWYTWVIHGTVRGARYLLGLMVVCYVTWLWHRPKWLVSLGRGLILRACLILAWYGWFYNVLLVICYALFSMHHCLHKEIWFCKCPQLN